MYIQSIENERLDIVYEAVEYFVITDEGYDYWIQPENRPYQEQNEKISIQC